MLVIQTWAGVIRLSLIFSCALVVSLAAGCSSAPKLAFWKKSQEDTVYLFAYFIKNGEDGLHFAASKNAYDWVKLNNGNSYVTPVVGESKLMRDPCIIKGVDGRYHMVWTSGWKEKTIGYASSTDLIHWSEQAALPVMAHEPEARNAWAPEVIYDKKKKRYVIFWSSTVLGKFSETQGTSEADYNHRIYYTTTTDFKKFAPTRLMYDPGFSVIDATFFTFKKSLYWAVKDETVNPPKKYLQFAEAKTVLGPMGKLSVPISPEGLWVEGPTAIEKDGEVIIYFDAYTKKHYGALKSKDLIHWEDVSAQMNFPDEGTPNRMRHGTVIQVPASTAKALGYEG